MTCSSKTTTTDLLTLLALVDDQSWYVRTDGAIRSTRNDACPLCMLFTTIGGRPPRSRVVPELEFTRQFGDTADMSTLDAAMNDIVAAADNPAYPYRAELEAVLGISKHRDPTCTPPEKIVAEKNFMQRLYEKVRDRIRKPFIGSLGM